MSMEDLWITFDHDRLSLEEIKKGNYQSSTNSPQKSALDFCFDWLNGKERFELQTSGSTGVPKLIEVTRHQLTASAALTASTLGLQRNETALVCLDTRYIAGVMMMVRSLEVGMNMIIVTPASNPLEKIEEETRIDFTAIVPLQLETILKSPQKEKLNQIKIALIGGAAINTTTIRHLSTMPCRFYATYGMTETLSHVALQKLNGDDAQNVFRALPGIILSKDKRGCLVIGASHISESPIVTNDLVEFTAPGQFQYLGRIDNLINTGGVKVIPEKIEASVGLILDEMGISTRFFIAPLPDDLFGASVNLFIEGVPFPAQTEDRIQEKLKAALDKYERPKSIRYVSTFINTDTGKINKLKTIASIQA